LYNIYKPILYIFVVTMLNVNVENYLKMQRFKNCMPLFQKWKPQNRRTSGFGSVLCG